jgi:hypothetical protein
MMWWNEVSITKRIGVSNNCIIANYTEPILSLDQTKVWHIACQGHALSLQLIPKSINLFTVVIIESILCNLTRNEPEHTQKET